MCNRMSDELKEKKKAIGLREDLSYQNRFTAS